MSRVRFEELPGGKAGGAEASFRKPPAPPPGYTGNTVITEWLTLHCRGDWGSLSDGAFVRVRFADPADCDRAAARFG
jgi:hypothetical protein